jgi:hypothetical protein
MNKFIWSRSSVNGLISEDYHNHYDNILILKTLKNRRKD